MITFLIVKEIRGSLHRIYRTLYLFIALHFDTVRKLRPF